jgi:hypothetical protein
MAIMTLEEIYNKWHSALQQPDDSMFYYHPNVERILLCLSIFVLTPQPDPQSQIRIWYPGDIDYRAAEISCTLYDMYPIKMNL